MNIGLLILRVTLGLTLASHGTQKLFGWFGGPGLDGTGNFLASLGFPPGRRHALMAGFSELGGGLLLALGLLTPLGAVAAISVMVVAVLTVHIKNGFFATNGGFEFNLLVAVSALALAFTGPGVFSLDAMSGHILGGRLWGTAALVAGFVCGIAPLLERHTKAPQLATAK
jgi:putative oxidoreductase